MGNVIASFGSIKFYFSLSNSLWNFTVQIMCVEQFNLCLSSKLSRSFLFVSIIDHDQHEFLFFFSLVIVTRSIERLIFVYCLWFELFLFFFVGPVEMVHFEFLFLYCEKELLARFYFFFF